MAQAQICTLSLLQRASRTDISENRLAIYANIRPPSESSDDISLASAPHSAASITSRASTGVPGDPWKLSQPSDLGDSPRLWAKRLKGEHIVPVTVGAHRLAESSSFTLHEQSEILEKRFEEAFDDHKVCIRNLRAKDVEEFKNHSLRLALTYTRFLKLELEADPAAALDTENRSSTEINALLKESEKALERQASMSILNPPDAVNPSTQMKDPNPETAVQLSFAAERTAAAYAKVAQNPGLFEEFVQKHCDCDSAQRLKILIDERDKLSTDIKEKKDPGILAFVLAKREREYKHTRQMVSEMLEELNTNPAYADDREAKWERLEYIEQWEKDAINFTNNALMTVKTFQGAVWVGERKYQENKYKIRLYIKLVMEDVKALVLASEYLMLKLRAPDSCYLSNVSIEEFLRMTLLARSCHEMFVQTCEVETLGYCEPPPRKICYELMLKKYLGKVAELVREKVKSLKEVKSLKDQWEWCRAYGGSDIAAGEILEEKSSIPDCIEECIEIRVIKPFL